MVRSATALTGRSSRFLDLLRRTLEDLIDRDLLADAGPGGIAAVPIPFRELHDPSDIAGILQEIARKAESRDREDLVDLIKYLYILQYSLGVPIAEFDGCVREVVARLEGIGLNVTIPREGELLDAKTMFALEMGGRVKQPMGVTLRDKSGKVISKGKVLCR